MRATVHNRLLPGDFDAFSPYVKALEDLARRAMIGEIVTAGSVSVTAHLDGQAGRELRAHVALELLRRDGAFFTGELLSARALAHVPSWSTAYYDLTCGCGDLLVAAARRLPVEDSVGATLRAWNRRLGGLDQHDAFVRATRARLALFAMARGAAPTRHPPNLERVLSNVRTGDLFGFSGRLPAGAALLLNPPYGSMATPPGVDWSSGLVSTAAVFTIRALDLLPADGHAAAILPDVLRSGARYDRWRAVVERRAGLQAVELFGQFDALTDVDVFLLALSARKPGSRSVSWHPVPTQPQTIGTRFSVTVGAVVDFRSPKRGPWRPYLVGRGLSLDRPAIPQKRRRFSGTVVEPPFVVVARTGRPGDRPRARASLVLGDEAVAVENHLIVLKPRLGGQPMCERLLRLLHSKTTSTWLDRRIRCRHLTVGALKDIPLDSRWR